MTTEISRAERTFEKSIIKERTKLKNLIERTKTNYLDRYYECNKEKFRKLRLLEDRYYKKIQKYDSDEYKNKLNKILDKLDNYNESTLLFSKIYDLIINKFCVKWTPYFKLNESFKNNFEALKIIHRYILIDYDVDIDEARSIYYFFTQDINNCKEEKNRKYLKNQEYFEMCENDREIRLNKIMGCNPW